MLTFFCILNFTQISNVLLKTDLWRFLNIPYVYYLFVFAGASNELSWRQVECTTHTGRIAFSHTRIEMAAIGLGFPFVALFSSVSIPYQYIYIYMSVCVCVLPCSPWPMAWDCELGWCKTIFKIPKSPKRIQTTNKCRHSRLWSAQTSAPAHILCGCVCECVDN